MKDKYAPGVPQPDGTIHYHGGEQPCNGSCIIVPTRTSSGSEGLTETEHLAITKLAEVADLLAEIVGSGPAREADLAELFSSIHHLQARVMAQAAARHYPILYRLLGEVLEP